MFQAGIGSATINISGTDAFVAFSFLALLSTIDQPIVQYVNLPAVQANHPPFVLVRAPLVGAVATQTIQAGATAVFTATGTDIDVGETQTLTYSWEASRGSIQSGRTARQMTWIAPAAAGIATLSVTVTDGRGGTGQARIAMLVTNTNPARTLTVTWDRGTGVQSPTGSTLPDGTMVTLTGTPAPGYILSGYVTNIPGGLPSTNPVTFPLTTPDTRIQGVCTRRFSAYTGAQFWKISDQGQVLLTTGQLVEVAAEMRSPYYMPTPGDQSFVAWDSTENIAAGIRTDGSIYVSESSGSIARNHTERPGIRAFLLPDFNTPPAGNDFVDVSIGMNCAYALKRDGTIQAWGSSLDIPQVGPPSSLSDVVRIARHGVPLAIRRDGSLAVWTPWAVGDFTIEMPNQVQGKRFVAIAGDLLTPTSAMMAALDDQGTLIVWVSQLSDGAQELIVGQVPNTGLADICVVRESVLGLKKNGTVAVYAPSGDVWNEALLLDGITDAKAMDVTVGQLVVLDGDVYKTFVQKK